MKQRLSLLWMLLLCFVAGAWADTEVSPVGGTSNATVNGTSFSINGTTNAGSGTKISPMSDKGIKVRVSTPLVMTVNAGYRIDGVTAYAAANDNSKTFTIEKIEVDGTEYVPSGVTMPITCAQKNASEATTISIPSITARDNITFTFGGTASQGIMEFHVDYTQEQVILQEITDVTLNGASIGETALATLKADKAVTIDGSSLNGIGTLGVTLSSGATTVSRSIDSGNVIYTFTTNNGADSYTVTVTGATKKYDAAQGTVVYYNGDALSNEKKTLTIDGIAFNYASKTFGYANNTDGVTLGETTYKPIKLSTGEAVTVTFPEGKKATKIIVYGWSAGGLGTGKLVNFTDGGEKSVDTSNDIFYANDGSGSVYPSVYEYEVDNWEAFTFQGNGDQPFVVMDFVFASEAPATKYTIGKTILPEGAATFNLTVTEAAAGEEVTATIDPTSVTFAEGWGWNNINEHSLVSLKTESGVDVPFTINDATRSATFTMPAENVIATFQLFPEYQVSLQQAVHGTYKVDGHEAGTGMKRYEGEVSEFTEIVPDFGYKLGTITVTAEDGTDVPVTDYKFTMPAQKVTVTVTFVPEPVNLTVTKSGGGDLTAAIQKIKADLAPEAPIKNLTITLEEGNYTVSAPIEASGNIIINGNGSTIDASALTAPFIALSAEPIAAFLPKNDGSGNTDYYGIESININNVKVTGLKNSIFWDSNKKYCVVDFKIDNSVFALATEAVSNEALISFQAGGAKDFTVKNSTISGNNAVAKYFVRYNNASRIDRYGFVQGEDTWSFTYVNNTFYGLLKSDGQWGNYSGITGKKTQGIITVNNNLWVDCDAQTMRRMLNSQAFSGFNASSTMAGNVFNIAGAVVDQGTYGNGSDLNGIVTFTDAANGDFTPTLLLAPGSMSAPESIGDPRWIPLTLVGSYSITVDENIENGTVKADAPYAAVGTEIKVTATPAADYELETLYYEIEGDNGIYEITDGKFDMPNGNVTIKATFKSTATGISSIENGQLTIDNDAPAYNLAGQKVSNSYKGVVIKNGRKVVIK